ncbi:MBL fold metallo-hydrolase [bacterium]|nr:MBL fold metallo-hydrolase [bacterium]
MLTLRMLAMLIDIMLVGMTARRSPDIPEAEKCFIFSLTRQPLPFATIFTPRSENCVTMAIEQNLAMTLKNAFLFISFHLFLVAAVTAQGSIDFSSASQQEARRVLDSNIHAFGGIEAVKRARNFSLKLNGKSYQLFQNSDPELPFEGWALERTIVYEADKNRLYHERILRDVDSDYVWWVKEIVRNGEGFNIIVHKNWLMEMRKPALTDFADIPQLLPQNILADALEQNRTLRWLGNDTFKGRKQDVITFIASTGQMLNLYFDSVTHLLTKYDWFYTRNVWGDTLGESIFTGYRDAEGTRIPISRLTYHNKVLSAEMNYLDAQFSPQHVDENLFKPSQNLIKLDVVEPKTEVLRMAESVYLLRNLAGGFNVLFVEFKDFILAAEAPEENIVNGISEEAVRKIKETIPNKPIRYIVPTHHHGDHSAGVRAFMAEGATVITTRGNLKYIDRLARAKFTFAPDAFARKPAPYKVDAIEDGKRIISDGNQVVEIHQFSPLSHVKEMLLVYLPKLKILYQSDMFNPINPKIKSTEDDPFHGINSSNTKDLLNTIRKLGLDVETIVGSHGRVSYMKELLEEVRQFENGKAK